MNVYKLINHSPVFTCCFKKKGSENKNSEPSPLINNRWLKQKVLQLCKVWLIREWKFKYSKKEVLD